MRALLACLTLRVRGHTRRADLDVSQVQDMLVDASDLLAFFEANAVVTNAACQTPLALRLSLLLERLQRGALLGESAAPLAANDRRSLLDWRAAFRPVVNTATSRTVVPCTSSNPSRKCKNSTRERSIVVCMDIYGHICGARACSGRRSCAARSNAQAGTPTSRHTHAKVRRGRMNRCLGNVKNAFIRDETRVHAREAVKEFRALNEKAVFVPDFRRFLKQLQDTVDRFSE